MTVPAVDNWCTSCEEACHDHPRVCTVCGTSLTGAPPQQAASSVRRRSNTNGNPRTSRSRNQDATATATALGDDADLMSPIPAFMREDLRAAARELRAVVDHVRQQIDSTNQDQQTLLQELAATRDGWQAIPAALMDPTNANGASASGGTAQASLDALPRITLAEKSSLFHQATLTLHHKTGVVASPILMEAIPGEFGTITHAQSELARTLLDGVLVVAKPLTGKGGTLSTETMERIRQASSSKSSAGETTSVIVYMERGDGVTFVQKAVLAQKAGAKAVVIGNHVSDPWPYCMRDSKGEAQSLELRIPVVMVKMSDGKEILRLQRLKEEEKTASSVSSCCLPCALSIQSQGQDCVVCTEAFAVGDKILRLPACGHVFHETCALQWLTKHNTCPYCRRELPAADAEYERERLRQQRTHAGSESNAAGSTSFQAFYG